MAEPTTNASMLRELLTSSARQEEKLARTIEVISRLERLVFGNGEPGLKSRIESVERRLAQVEICQEDCPVDEIQKMLGVISTRHTAEDDVAKENKEAKKAEAAEFRRFKWVMFGSIIMFTLDIVLRIFNIGN